MPGSVIGWVWSTVPEAVAGCLGFGSRAANCSAERGLGNRRISVPAALMTSSPLSRWIWTYWLVQALPMRKLFPWTETFPWIETERVISCDRRVPVIELSGWGAVGV